MEHGRGRTEYGHVEGMSGIFWWQANAVQDTLQKLHNMEQVLCHLKHAYTHTSTRIHFCALRRSFLVCRSYDEAMKWIEKETRADDKELLAKVSETLPDLIRCGMRDLIQEVCLT